MSVQENNGSILTGRGQAQSQGQVQSGSERAQSHGQAQSHEQVPSHEQAPSGSTSMAVQMLKNKNKVRGEIKLVDKEEDPLEPIRRFNQVNEETKKSYDEYAAKIKQRGEDMKNLMREAEAKYHPDLDSDKDKGLDSDKNSGSDTDRESALSDDFVYVQKPKTNKFKCEECNEELTLKNYNRHIQSLKHKKNARIYNRNKTTESANEDGIKLTNKDIEQKLDEQYPEEGIKYCDSCEINLDNNTAYNNHVTT